MGIAIPYYLWDLGAEMEPWRGRDLRAELASDLGMPVWLRMTAPAPAALEMIFGATDLPGKLPVFLHRPFRRRRRGAGPGGYGAARNAGALGVPSGAGRPAGTGRGLGLGAGNSAGGGRCRAEDNGRDVPPSILPGVAGQIRGRAVPCGRWERWRFWTCRWW